MNNFDLAVEFVLKREGGYVNHPDDKGGPTNFGITLGTLGTYRNQICTNAEIQALTREEAIEIYKNKYWTPYNLDKVMDTNFSTIIFDQFVNRGPRAVITHLREFFAIPIGDMDSDLLFHINQSPRGTLFEYVMNCQEKYARICQKNPSQIVFLVGWLRRTHELLRLLL